MELSNRCQSYFALGRYAHVASVLSLFCWLWMVAACHSPVVVGGGEPAALEATPHISLPPTLSAHVPGLQPPVILTSPTAEMPSFALATAAPPAETVNAPTAASTPAADNVTLLLPRPTLPAGTAASGAASQTPLPTFTRPAAPAASGNDHFWLARPVPQGGVVWTDKAYPYGSTRGGTLRPHHGVEFNVPAGTPIFAAASGVVLAAGDDLTTPYGPHTNFYGNLVIIQHDFLYNNQALYTLYAHLSEVQVVVGQVVDVAQQIALSGGSGVADGPHLHFEVRVGQNSYQSTRNPLLWLNPFPGRGAVAGRVTFADGRLAYEMPVTLRRLDAPSPYNATTTYAQEQLNPDDLWQENFVLDDVAAGYYVLTVGQGEATLKSELWVYPNQTSFVELAIE